jgi:hypothetical protein
VWKEASSLFKEDKFNKENPYIASGNVNWYSLWKG